MKKILLILILLLAIGCKKEDEDEIKRIEKLINDPQPTSTPTATPYVDTNPIKVGFYKNGKLITEYNNKFKDRTDIAVLNIVFTNDEQLNNSNFKTAWKNYYDKYDNINDYKIGFEVSFTANDKEYNNVILDPSNGEKLYPYLFTYLYDDIHNSGHYSHVTTEQVKDDTVYSSIKVYLHQKTNEITSPITLTVFTYKDDNDFLDEHYRGNIKYTITINNK